MPRTSCSHKNCRLRTLVAAILAALVLATLAGLGDAASAQRAQRNANTAQQKKAASKRVFVGPGSSSASGARQTIKSDNPLNDYSAYRSGDRFNVVIPNADANSIAKGGAGRGYTDMQVQQRGNDVVLTYKLQPGAKPRVEQKFNRLDVVFETPEGAPAKSAQTQTAAPANDPRTSAAQQNQTATRNAQTASPSSNNNAAANRTAANPNATTNTQPANPSQHEAHQQQQSASTQSATAPPASGQQTAAPTTAAETSAATPEAAQSQPAATPAGLQIAQARQPETTSPGASTKAPATTSAPSPSLGAALIRNWPVALALALLLGGLGLFFAARRTSNAVRTPPPVEEAARPAVIEKTEPVPIVEAKPAPLVEATTTPPPPPVEATAPAVVPVPVVFADTKDDAKETARPQHGKERGRKNKNKKAGKAKQKPEAPAVVADKQEAPASVSENTAAATPLVETPVVATLVAASALAGVTAASEESTDEETKTAPPAEVEETRAVEEPAVAETAVEESAVAEPVEEAAAEEAAGGTVVDEGAAVEAPSVEESAPEVAAVQESASAVAALEETLVEEAAVGEAVAETTVDEGAAVEDASVDEAAGVGTVGEETLVEEAAAVESSSVEPSVAEPSSVELAPVESSLVEAPSGEEVSAGVVAPAAAAVTAVEAAAPSAEAATADAEAVQAETKKLLDGERYDRGVLKSADMMARQMVAAELLSALSGRNPERRWRARTAFIEHGFFNESAHDLHYAEAPAERAAAARALALAGDRAATSHLAAALEDKEINVRRAVVEALADLRDPAAVGPLEELRERQKSHREKLPRRLLQHAIEACREGSAVAPVFAAPAAVEEAAIEAPAREASTAPSAEAAPVETSEAGAAVAEEAEPVIEDSAAWFSLVSSGGAPAVEEMKADEPTVAAVDESAVVVHQQETAVVEAEEEAAVAESRVAETREETFIEKSVAPVVAEEVEPSASAAVGEVSPVEESSLEETRGEETRAVEPVAAAPSFETEAVVTAESKEVEPVIEDAAAWFSLVSAGDAEAVEETKAEEARAAESPVEAATVEETPAAGADSGEALPAWAIESEAATLESFDMPAVGGAKSLEPASPAAESSLGSAAEDWIELDVEETSFAPAAPEAPAAPSEVAAPYDAPTEIEARSPKPPPPAVPPSRFARTAEPQPRAASEEKGVELFDELSTVPRAIQQRITSADTSDRASALADLSRLDTDEAFHQICAAFDDDSREVRNAAARALFDLRPDRADSFTRALRESTPERRRNIGAAINNSGLAADAVGQLTGESREKTYEAFSLLFLMAKAGEVQPLLRAIETHPDSEVRLAVVKLLALSGQKEILPAFRRLAVRGSLPTEVRSAVMEAIYQISSQDAHSAA